MKLRCHSIADVDAAAASSVCFLPESFDSSVAEADPNFQIRMRSGFVNFCEMEK